jgi:ubiquinone/menaquinone biosynthesis C-methylase UbiE
MIIQKKITKEWFRGWSNEYDKTLGKMARHHKLLELAVKLSGVKDDDKVLDVGCGTGLLSLKFIKKTNCSVVGIDNSEEMLSIFRKKIAKFSLNRRIICRFGDASSLKFENNAFDVIASTVTLHHLKNKYPAIKKIYNILKPGGRFILGDIDLDTTGSVTNVSRLKRIMDYLKDELVLALEDGGAKAMKRMFDNGKKHLFNEGEYCIGFKQWSALCKKAGFRKITVKALPGFERFKVLTAFKDRVNRDSHH